MSTLSSCKVINPLLGQDSYRAKCFNPCHHALFEKFKPQTDFKRMHFPGLQPHCKYIFCHFSDTLQTSVVSVVTVLDTFEKLIISLRVKSINNRNLDLTLNTINNSDSISKHWISSAWKRKLKSTADCN